MLLLLSANIQSEKHSNETIIREPNDSISICILDIVWKYSWESRHNWLSSGGTGILFKVEIPLQSQRNGIIYEWPQLHLMYGALFRDRLTSYLRQESLFNCLVQLTCSTVLFNLFKDLKLTLDARFILFKYKYNLGYNIIADMIPLIYFRLRNLMSGDKYLSPIWAQW